MARTKVTEIRPYVHDTVVGTGDQLARVLGNPYIRDVEGARRLGPNRYSVKVVRADPTPQPAPRRRLPYRLELAPGARRPAAFASGAVLAVALLLGTGWAVHALWGDTIASFLRAYLPAAGAVLILSATLIAWVGKKLATGRCPGLHCTGCGHQ